MKKQTAVEELVEDLIESGYLSHEEMPKGLIFRAKAIEEEHLIEAHKSGQHYANNFEVPHEEEAVRYYNETFKSE